MLRLKPPRVSYCHGLGSIRVTRRDALVAVAMSAASPASFMAVPILPPRCAMLSPSDHGAQREARVRVVVHAAITWAAWTFAISSPC